MPIYLCTCCGCSRYSAFSRDIYLTSRVVLLDFPHIPRTCTTFACVANIFYFGDLAANLFVHMPWMLREFHIPPGQQGLFFSGFLDTTSCRCSGVSQDIYPDTGGCFFFGFLYILQMLWKFRIFLGHLPRHRGCYFRVFRTLHHADVPIFLETFTWTWGFFFLGFPHTTSCRCSDFSQDIYTDTGVVFFGFSTQLKCLISLFPGLPLTHTKI